MYDVTNPDSLDLLDPLFSHFRDNLNIYESSNYPLLLLGNKWDLGDHSVPRSAGVNFARSHLGMLFREVSAATPAGVNEALNDLVRRRLAPNYFEFQPVAFPIRSGEKYIVRSVAVPTMALDIAEVSKAPGGRLTIWAVHKKENQQWVYDRSKRTLKSVNSGLVLAPQKDGHVVQVPEDGKENQRWEWHREDGTLRTAGLMCLEIRGEAKKGAGVWIAPIARSNLQRWEFERLS
jgi:hypothetical protein